MHEYLFDVRLNASIRIEARSEAEAIKIIESIDANTANLGAAPNGDPIVCEVSIFENAAGGALKAVEIDGEEIDDAGIADELDEDGEL